jgi:ABC-type lipoprotein export system ATPase subunit
MIYPGLLLPEEPTSALDNESERIVQKALDKTLQMKRNPIIIVGSLSREITRSYQKSLPQLVQLQNDDIYLQMLRNRISIVPLP